MQVGQICILALATAALASCDGAGAGMRAGDASAFLAQFADGRAPADVCTPQGRGMLRTAVRAYGAAMAANGAAWPLDAEQALGSMETTVLASVATGLIERSDLRGSARGAALQLASSYLPDASRFHGALSAACVEMVALQQAAARYILEGERQRSLLDYARDNGAAAQARAVRHEPRVERARVAMELAAHAVEARLDARAG